MTKKPVSKAAARTNGVDLAAVVARMEQMQQNMAMLMQTNEALLRDNQALQTALAEKPATKAVAKAAPVVREFEYDLTEAKYGTGITMKFEGRKLDRFMYLNELRILAKHISDVIAATKHIKE